MYTLTLFQPRGGRFCPTSQRSPKKFPHVYISVSRLILTLNYIFLKYSSQNAVIKILSFGCANTDPKLYNLTPTLVSINSLYYTETQAKAVK